LLLDHTKERPDSGLPVASSAVAVSGTRDPTAPLACGGVTVTLATGGGSTVIVASPDLPLELAATCVEPGASAVTTPPGDTVAILLSRTDQRTTVPVTRFPSSSWIVA
jgi:hypothetical protein